MLDPISAALIAGATGGITDASKTAVTDAYHALTEAIRRRLGHEHAVVKAVEAVESKPTSTGRQSTLIEEVTDAGADHDADLLALASQLRHLLAEHAQSNATVQQIITGNYNATSVYGDASVTVEAPKEP